MFSNNAFLKLNSTIIMKGIAPTSVSHDVELDCEDTAFFCALHVLEYIKAMSYYLHDGEREDFYNFIKVNLRHGIN